MFGFIRSYWTFLQSGGSIFASTNNVGEFWLFNIFANIWCSQSVELQPSWWTYSGRIFGFNLLIAWGSKMVFPWVLKSPWISDTLFLFLGSVLGQLVKILWGCKTSYRVVSPFKFCMAPKCLRALHFYRQPQSLHDDVAAERVLGAGKARSPSFQMECTRTDTHTHRHTHTHIRFFYLTLDLVI